MRKSLIYLSIFIVSGWLLIRLFWPAPQGIREPDSGAGYLGIGIVEGGVNWDIASTGARTVG